MNSSSRTMTFAGVAAVSALLAWGAWSSTQPSSVAGFGDVGQLFFPDFEDALAAKGLTVVDYDDDIKDAAEFSVTQNENGLWTIPSHHNYPAEAKDRLAKTATSLMGVKKTAVQSRLKEDWKRYGVVDPRAEGLGTPEERGTRLTLNDGSGNPLVDLIVGNEVEGRSGHFYVREPEKDTTYVTEFEGDLSAKFSDWIEPDLLKISSSDVIKVTLDNYSINETERTVEGKEKLEFAKADLKTSGDWELAGLDDEKEELDASPVTSLVTNLDQLKIVGVRPKPEELDSNLRLPPQIKQALQQQLDREMSARGFFFGSDGEGGERLYSNEGDMIAGLSNGVEYSLYFGEIARGTGKDIEVGLGTAEEESDDKEEGDDEKSEDADEASDEEDEDGPRRYLFLKAAFNEALLGEKPVAPVEPVKPDILKEVAADEPDAKGDEADAKGDEGDAKGDEADAKGDEADAKGDEGDARGDEGDARGDEADADDSAEEASNSDAAEADAAGTDDAEAANEEAADAGSKEESTADGQASDKAADVKEEQEAAEEKADTKDEAETSEKSADEEAAPEKKEAAETDKDGKSDESDAEEKSAGSPESDVKEKAADTEKKEPEKDPKQVAQEEYDKAMGTYEAEKRAYETKLKEFDEKVEEGKEKAEELSDRFAAWYYVISSDSFEKFRLTRKDVIKKKEVKEDDNKEGEKKEDDTAKK